MYIATQSALQAWANIKNNKGEAVYTMQTCGMI